MVAALEADPSTCTKYETSYGTGHFSGCLVNTTVSFGGFKLENMSMAAAREVGDIFLTHGTEFR